MANKPDFSQILNGLNGRFNFNTPPRREARHTNLVRKLENLLFYESDYDSMFFFLEYCKNGFNGEIDLLAIADDVFDFYEVKCTDNYKNRKRATKQYSRFKNAFPEWNTNGYFYSGQEIRTI